MKRLTLLLITCVLLIGCGHSRPWTKKEITLAGISIGAAAADYYTTRRNLSENPNNYEINPILGPRPEGTELVCYFVTSQLLTIIVADYFDSQRSYILTGKTAINTGCAIHNNEVYHDRFR